jgi:hypothetical protein
VSDVFTGVNADVVDHRLAADNRGLCAFGASPRHLVNTVTTLSQLTRVASSHHSPGSRSGLNSTSPAPASAEWTIA